MRVRGITYDTGFSYLGVNTRQQFAVDDVERETAVIVGQLHCNAIRIMGDCPDRIELAARSAASSGLEVWISPIAWNRDFADFMALTLECSDRAERLRGSGANVVCVVASDLSLLSSNMIAGDTFEERTSAIIALKPGTYGQTTHRSAQLNEFLTNVVAAVRRRFGGPVTYASLPFEGVDWANFDIVASNGSCNWAEAPGMFKERLRALTGFGKPVAMTRFGCPTHQNAPYIVDRGNAAVNYRDGTPVGLAEVYIRDEVTQATYIRTSLQTLQAEGIDHVFVDTFASYSLPHCEDPKFDLDIASCGLVKILNREGDGAHHSVQWEPKLAFAAVAECYRSADQASTLNASEALTLN